MKLTDGQISSLRSVPASAGPNRVRLAITLVDARNSDVAIALGWKKNKVSQIVNGRYKSVSIDDGHALAGLFGVYIEDLFPDRRLEPGASGAQEHEGTVETDAAAALPTNLDEADGALQGAYVGVDDVSVHGTHAEASDAPMLREKRGEDSREGAPAR